LSLSVSEEIEKPIKAAIFSEQLKPGHRLPPEIQLSQIFKTSRNTIREALRTFEKDGLIVVKSLFKNEKPYPAGRKDHEETTQFGGIKQIKREESPEKDFV